MKTKITILLAILFSLYSFGQTVGSIFPSGGLYFKITSASTVEVSEGNQNFVGVANIPSTALSAGITYEVTSIGIHAFKQSPTLTSVIIPNSVTSIKSEAFVSCLSLNSVTIGNSVTSIGERAFQYCSGLTSVIIGSSVTTINAGAFHGCVNLKSITIPNSVTNIGQEAFYFCSGLTAVNIGNSIMSIGEGTFKNCVKLTSINIPSSVVSIGYGAFNNCSSLTSVTVNWTAPLNITADVFSSVNLSPIKLNVPEGTETDYKNALVWKDFGTIATLATNNFSLKNKVNFYPNPTTSSITFSQEINTLEVFDIAGKKVKSFQKPSATYDVSTIEKGVYILKGKTSQGKGINEKLIKG